MRHRGRDAVCVRGAGLRMTDVAAPSMADVARAIRQGFTNWPVATSLAFVSRYVPRANPVIRWNTRQGTSFETPPGDRAWWSSIEIFPLDSYRLDDLRLRTVFTFLDIGANVGTFSLAVAERFPGARGVAVEPIPRTVRYLRRNLARNGLIPAVSPRWGAVTAAGDAAEFVYDPKDSSRATAVNSPDAAGERVTVPAFRLAELAEEFPGGIDLVKIDIEGGEYELVEHLVEFVRAMPVGRLVIEYHDVPGRGIADLVDALPDGRMEPVRDDQSSTPRVGLVFFDRAA
jgi:FkbM family methyltransferase